MSGAEIWGAIAGVIGVLDAIANVQDRRDKRRREDVSHEEAARNASFHRYQIRSALDVLYKDREIYEKNIEDTVDERTKAVLSEVWDHIKATVQRCCELADELEAAVNREPADSEQISACERNLESNHRYLDFWVNTVKLNLDLDKRLTRRYPRTLPYRPPTPPSTPPPEEVAECIEDDRLLHYVEDDNLAEIRNYIESCQGDPEEPSRKATALLLACRYRKKELVEYCLSVNPDTTIEDDCGLGVIHNVIGSTDYSPDRPSANDILELLLEYGVDPSTPDSTERKLTPLHRAADHGDLEAVKALLAQQDGLINAKDAQGLTPLWSACTRPRPDMNVIKNIARKKGNFGEHDWPKASSEITELLVNEKVKGYEDFKN